ncbi:hypothetical protein CWI66_16040 [Halomonas sp. 141]|nr:hypothetical protein CWI66_16040 [Halomonas sp. 141]
MLRCGSFESHVGLFVIAVPEPASSIIWHFLGAVEQILCLSLILLLAIALMHIFPEIALYLPQAMNR